MSNKNRIFVFVVALSMVVITSAACHGPDHDMTATEQHMAHMENAKANYGRHLDDMVDNGILRDMSLADFHFVAHSSEISGTGASRLNRMAHLLNTYGGTVRYETDEADATLVSQRIDHVKEYLTMAGTNMDRVQVKSMISGGGGMTARKAMEVDAKGTVNPAAGASGGLPTSGMMASPSGR